jgi:hypothetical protein
MPKHGAIPPFLRSRHSPRAPTLGQDAAIAPAAPIPYAWREAKGRSAMLYHYAIVPKGGHEGQALEKGTLGDLDLDAATRLARTVNAPNASGKTGLEVILLNDSGDQEVWRGPYHGPV